jgi:CRP-like cAMP-binding protein
VTPRPFGNCSGCRFGEYIDLSELGASDIELLNTTQVIRKHGPGACIFNQDDEPQGIYCVASGYVLLWRIDAFGNETAFGLIGPGGIMGYRSCFAGKPHAATARALTECQVCLVPNQTIWRLFDGNPALERRFLFTLARDPGPVDGLLLRANHVPIRTRLVSLLLIFRERFAERGAADSAKFKLPITRQDIAALLGARPETVTRTIRELEDDGIVFFDRRYVDVPNLKQLYEITGLNEPI